jgi:Kunitz/Bovine pancreatic trypsin inhibitor domain
MKKFIFLMVTLILSMTISCSKIENLELEPDVILRELATESVAFYELKSYKMLSNKCAVDPQSVVLADKPLFTQNGIVSYAEKEFTYTITANSYANVQQLKDATPIAVCLDKKVVFVSIFKPLTSSSPCYHSITMQTLPPNQIKFQLGYPTLPNGILIDDQRNNAALIEALKASNKLSPPFTCVNNAADKSLLVEDVKSKIYGEWKLGGLIADRPNPQVPEIKVVFKDVLGAPIDKQVADVYLNCKLAYTTLYSLKQINGNIKSVRLEPDKKEYKVNEPAVLTGAIRICDGELMIDTGMAFDAPAYLFRKINTASCSLKPETGLCMAALKRYYYDPVEKKCKEFVWGGCGGVVPFETLEACKSCECNQ